MRSTVLVLSWLCLLPMGLMSQTLVEAEPNNTFATANPTQQDSSMTGTVGNTPDLFDYFWTIPEDDGTLVFEAIVTGNANGNDFYIQVTNKITSGIGNANAINVIQGITDTIHLEIPCVAKDTVYIRLQGNGGFTYDMRYTTIPSGQKDQEPNDNFASAQQINHGDTLQGRIGYANVALDVFDYYYTVVPDDGTLTLSADFISTSDNNDGDFYLQVFNKGGGLIANNNAINVPPGPGQVSVTEHCVAADTVYFRVQSAGCFSYDLSYTLTPSGQQDQEPNDVFASAQQINHGDTIQGRIGYANVALDVFDYYYTVIPDDGTLTLSADFISTSDNNGGDFYLQVFNKGQSSIANNNAINVPPGPGQVSVTEHCVAADTVYFRVQSAGCFSYDLSYTVTPSGQADQEPNDTRATARSISLRQPTSGRVGYVNQQVDGNDYFTFRLDTFSTLTMPLDVVNTSGATSSDLFIRVQNQQGGILFTQSLTNMSLSGVQDTFTISCLPPGDYFVWLQANGCFSYTFALEPTPQQPSATIVSANTGSIFGFEAVVNPQTDAIAWDLGDATSSSATYIEKGYDIGAYEVILTATNQSCNLSVNDTLPISVKGIEYYTPTSAGTGGDHAMQFFGGGLDTNVQIVLSRNGETYSPFEIYANENGTELQVLIDLHFASEGFYDVEVQIPGEAPILYPNGFEVNALQYPYTFSEITGPARYRTNRDTRFTLNVYNRGNIKASGVVTYLVWPKSVDITFLTDWFTPPDSGSYTITTEDTTFTWRYEDIQVFFDSALTSPTPIDSFAGEPYNGYSKRIWIPHIPAEGTYSIPFIARATSTGDNDFITYTAKPNLFGSCGNGSYMDMSENLAVESINAIDQGLSLAKMDKTPVGWLAKATKATTTHMANLGQVMGATYNYATGTTNSIYESLPADFDANVRAGNAQIASEVLQLGTDKLVDLGAAKFMKGQSDQINRWIDNNPNAELSSFFFALENLKDIEDVRQHIRDSYKTTKDLKTLYDKLSRLRELSKDCPELQKQLKDLEKEVGKELNQREKKKKKTRSVNSMDPNAIYGPSGVDSLQYINVSDEHFFLVTYENIDTASADAQIVKIEVPIDTAAYNIKSFSFHDFSIAEETYRIPKNRQSFVYTVDMRAKNGLYVRVMGWLDTLAGVANWTFTSLDGTTLELPILDGFLPPNKTAPEGEGSCAYSISLKPDVANGKRIESQATIYFDENEPILTNIWVNVIDRSPGTSSLTASLSRDTIFINTLGNDQLSGIDNYYIFVSRDGEPFVSVTSTVTGELTLIGEPGITYGFYCTSVDRVGNEESKPAVAEATVTISGVEEKAPNPLRVYPNPNNGQFLINSAVPIPNGQLQVLNFQGQVVLSQPIQLPENGTKTVSAGTLSPGPYVLEVLDEDGRAYRQIIMIQ